MIEIIILAILSFFIIKKLHSILGEENDRLYFDNDQSEFRIIKTVEPINFKNEINEDFNYLTPEAKKYANEINSKMINFNLQKFQEIAIKVMESVIKANDIQDGSIIKKFLSKELADLVCNSFNNEEQNHIVLISLKEAKICDILKNNSIYEIVMLFDMEQINYTTDKNSNVIDGNKSEIVNVKERWYFSHNINSKDTTWFVRKIEEI